MTNQPEDKFVLRLPDGLRDQLKELAETNRRSMNQEIVSIIMDALNENGNELMENIAPFGLRMQPDLKSKVKAAAKSNGRSINAEIIKRLLASFEGEQS